MIPLRQILRGLRPMARPVRGRAALSVLIGIVRIAASLGFVWICKRLVDIATGVTDAPLPLHIGIMLGIMLLQLVCSVCAGAWESYNLARTGNDLRKETFGRVLKTDLRAHRDELFISTKAGWDMWPGPYGDLGSRKYLLASLDQSLRRMGLEYVDVFYHHRPDPDTPMEESLGALADAVKRGKALYAGISSYDGAQTARAAKIMRDLGVPLLVNQVPFNLLNRRVKGDLAPVLEREGVGCTVFSPLAQGILTGKYLDGIPEGSRCARPEGFLRKEWVTDDDRRRVRAIKAIADRRGETLARFSLNWIRTHKWVSSILVGARSLDQLDQNLSSLKCAPLSAAEMAEIDRALAEAG